MSATFVPVNEDMLVNLFPGTYIKALIIDESGSGVEIRVMSDGQVLSLPLTSTIEHYRTSPLWEEVKQD